MSAIGETYGRVRRDPADVGSPTLVDAAALAASGVSWPAIWGGAVAAVATTLVLVELGAGLGLSSTSFWQDQGASAATLGIAGGIWLIVTQWIAAGIGGYMSGRLRTKWTGLHTDEVFFRDTAHGFVTWSVATIITGIFVAWVAASGLHAAGSAANSAIQGASQGAAQGAAQQAAVPVSPFSDPYYTDLMFRSNSPAAGDTSQSSAGATNAQAANGNNASRGEVTRILARDLRNGDVPGDDRAYIAQIVAARTGMSQADAQKRVDDTVSQMKAAEQKARQVADEARKQAARAAIIGALALVIGAFIASASAALGGRLRDTF